MSSKFNPPRLLVVTPRYFPYMGGIETHVHEVGQRLAGAGVAVTVLTTDPSRRLPAFEEVAGMQVWRVPASPTKRDYCFAPGIYNVITRHRWDLIHFQGCHTLVPPLGMLAARRAKVPYVITIHAGGHSSRLRNKLRGVQFAMLRPLMVRADRLIAVSHYEAELFRKRLGLARERIVVIPNGVNIPFPMDPPPLTNDSTLIASVGRLERYKGHHRVIEAMPKLLEQLPDVRLLILGAGPYEPVLRRLAKSLGVAERVEIRAIPASDRVGLASQLLKASLVVLLSECESHPVAVMEALALHRPVLVADNSGFRELADRGLVRAVADGCTSEGVASAILFEIGEPLVPSNARFPTWDDCASAQLALYRGIRRSFTCAS